MNSSSFSQNKIKLYGTIYDKQGRRRSTRRLLTKKQGGQEENNNSQKETIQKFWEEVSNSYSFDIIIKELQLFLYNFHSKYKFYYKTPEGVITDNTISLVGPFEGHMSMKRWAFYVEKTIRILNNETQKEMKVSEALYEFSTTYPKWFPYTNLPNRNNRLEDFGEFTKPIPTNETTILSNQEEEKEQENKKEVDLHFTTIQEFFDFILTFEPTSKCMGGMQHENNWSNWFTFITATISATTTSPSLEYGCPLHFTYDYKTQETPSEERKGEKKITTTYTYHNQQYTLFSNVKDSPNENDIIYIIDTRSFIFPTNFKEQIDSCPSHLIILPLNIKLKIKEGHRNVIIIDKKNKTVERFEPHGESVPVLNRNGKEVLFNKYTDIDLKELFQENLPGYRYIPTLEYCPAIGPQNKQARQMKCDEGGYCVVYSALYGHLRLLFPNMSRKEIVETWLNSFTPAEMLNLIERYENWFDITFRNILFTEEIFDSPHEARDVY